MTKSEIIKESIEKGKTIKEIKEKIPEPEPTVTWDNKKGLGYVKPKKEKAKVEMKNQPIPEKLGALSQINDTIMLDITPEMAENLMMGILDTIAFLAPNTFNAPTVKHGEVLKMPAYTVLQRWMPKIDILKYLPEIILTTSVISILKDMKKQNTKEVKK